MTWLQANIEADAFWCFSKLLDDIQDHYTCSQPGLQRMVLRLEDLINRLDKELHAHFQEEGIQYLQFGFRWMNCALLRELPLRAILRLWDTYFSEDQGIEFIYCVLQQRISRLTCRRIRELPCLCLCGVAEDVP